MKIDYNIENDYVTGVDVHFKPVEFLLIHSILKDIFEISTDTEEVAVIGGMIDEIEEQLEEQVSKFLGE